MTYCVFMMIRSLQYDGVVILKIDHHHLWKVDRSSLPHSLGLKMMEYLWVFSTNPFTVLVSRSVFGDVRWLLGFNQLRWFHNQQDLP